MLGAFSLAGDGAEEGVGPQAGRLNGNAQGGGCGLQLGLADGIPGRDERGVAGVRKRVAQGDGPQGVCRIALGVLERAAVHRERGRALNLGVRGHAVADHGERIHHLER